MKFHKAWVATGFALALLSAPATAADWGGIKEIGGDIPIPVPAPAPVPTYDIYSDWYVGFAIGANVLQDATIEDSDINMPMKDSGDIGASPIFGLNFGRYITPSLRVEIAVDYTPDANITRSGTLNYVDSVSALNGGGVDTNVYGIARTDTVKLSRTTALVNLLYDIQTGTRFTPYIGGGVGFSWRKLRRNFSEFSSCVRTPEFPDLPLACDVSNYPALPTPNASVSGSSVEERFDFAAAVQAGIAYNITDSITWDNGWQMLWEGGAIASSAPSISGENRIVYKDSVLQQFRSGIRIKFD
jgi:opacity protein-like surface antigen